MNREQKKAMYSKYNNYFTRTGLKLFRKATGRSLDISALVKSDFDINSLSRHNKRLNPDTEFNDPDAIISEVICMLLSTPGDSFYPEISHNNKKWLAMLGIKPQKSRYGYIGGLLLYYRYLNRVSLGIIRDVINSVRQARKTGTLKGTPIHDKVNYMFSRSIANRYGYDKGRQRYPDKRSKDDDSQADIVRREVKLDITRHDFVISADTDQIENKLLYQQLTSIIQQLDSADKLAIRTQVLANQARIPFDTAYCQNRDEFNRLGINSARAALKRLRYLPTKYPELQVIRESLKR